MLSVMKELLENTHCISYKRLQWILKGNEKCKMIQYTLNPCVSRLQAITLNCKYNHVNFMAREFFFSYITERRLLFIKVMLWQRV